MGLIVGHKAKSRISKQLLQENTAHKIFRKTNFLTTWYGRAYQGLRNVNFSENSTYFAFLAYFAFFVALLLA